MTRLLIVFLALVVSALGAPVVRDLGEGLTYVGVATLPDDLPAAGVVAEGACVLDLRSVAAGDSEAAAAAAWLKARVRPATPVLVLANAETGFSLRLVLADRTPGSGLLVVGASGPGLVPDSAVTVLPEQERAALAALRAMAPIDELLRENRDKIRNDEASLLRDRPAEGDVPATPAKPAVAGVIDVALQRAVHVHRTLKALKRI
jgi:hypothetical protein